MSQSSQPTSAGMNKQMSPAIRTPSVKQSIWLNYPLRAEGVPHSAWLHPLLGGGLRDMDALYHPLEHPPKPNSVQTAFSPSTEAGTLPSSYAVVLAVLCYRMEVAPARSVRSCAQQTSVGDR